MYYLVTDQDWVNVFTYLSSYTGMIWALVQIFLAAFIFATPVAWMMIETNYGWDTMPQPEEENSMASYEEADTEEVSLVTAWVIRLTGKSVSSAEAEEIRNTMMSLPQESWEDYINSLKVMYAA